MSPEEMKARARRIPDEVFTQGDLAIADEVMALSSIDHVPGAAPFGGEGVKRWALALRHAFPDLCVVVEDELTEGDTVVQRLTYRGTHTGIFLGHPPTGKCARWSAMEMRRMGPDGRFAEQWIVTDLLSLLQQLGAIPFAFGAREELSVTTEGNG
jgi:predicted ester cyclase